MLHSRKMINNSYVISFRDVQKQSHNLWRPPLIRRSIVARARVEGGSDVGTSIVYILSVLFSPSGRSNKIKKMPGSSMMFGEWKFTCLWESWHLQYWLCWL